MIKTQSDIERDFYQFVSNSRLGRVIKGKVYRSDMRPENAKTEDIVVAFLSGYDGQEQTGEVIVNVYVPDTVYNDKKVRAHERLANLEALVPTIIEESRGSEYFVQTNGTPHVMKIDDIKQHCIGVRLSFKLITD